MITAYRDDIVHLRYELDEVGNYFVHCEVYQWSHRTIGHVMRTLSKTHKEYGEPTLYAATRLNNKLLTKFLKKVGFKHFRSVWWVDKHDNDVLLDIWTTEKINDYGRP